MGYKVFQSTRRAAWRVGVDPVTPRTLQLGRCRSLCDVGGEATAEQAAASAAGNGAAPADSVMPPGPPLPRLLQTLAFVFAPAPYIDACRRRYGDVVTMGTLFDSRFVMV